MESLENVSPEQKEKAEKLIDRFGNISSKCGLGLTNKMSLEIDTGDTKPFLVRQYPFSPSMLSILKKELDEMLKLRVVELS